jgi:hypothetical protein
MFMVRHAFGLIARHLNPAAGFSDQLAVLSGARAPLWGLLLRRLLKPLWILLAIVFLIEAWLWSHLAPIVGWVVNLISLPAIRARVAGWIEKLPPWATLFVFIIPAVLLFPIKLFGLWMLAKGSWLGAMATLGLAKVVSMGVTAFIFEVTRPKLLQMAWFRWVYEHILTGLAWAHAQFDPIKTRIKEAARETFAPIAKKMRSLFWLMRRERRGRFLRRLMRIRKRMQATPPAPKSA